MEKQVVTTFAGELDLTAAANVREVLAGVTPPATIDFSDVRYIDSSILTELLRFARRIAPHQATLVGLQPQVRRILTLVMFDKMFTLADFRSLRLVSDDQDQAS
jgi:anti-anti-sigma factor